jgi:hypothetical protein
MTQEPNKVQIPYLILSRDKKMGNPPSLETVSHCHLKLITGRSDRAESP